MYSHISASVKVLPPCPRVPKYIAGIRLAIKGDSTEGWPQTRLKVVDSQFQKEIEHPYALQAKLAQCGNS